MGLGKTLSEIEHVGPDEMAGWMAFWQLEPWGCPADDHRAELGLNLLYAVNSKSNAKIPLFIDRDPEGRVKFDPTPEQLDDSIMDFFLGKTIKLKPDDNAHPPTL
jgi:hypothetical protein